MSPFAAITHNLRRDVERRVRVVYPWELPSIMRKHIATGAMGSIYFVLLSGIFLVTFGNALGMTYVQWGFLSAASSFALVLQLLSAFLVSRTGNRMTLWFTTALASRICRALAIVLAFALIPATAATARLVFIGLLVLANCFDAICAPPWFSWLADIIPQDEHGRFMGRRSAWIALANMCALLPIGYGIDRVPEDWRLPALLVVFALAFGVGILDLFIHRTIPEPPMPLPPPRQFWHEIAAPFGDRRFRPWLAFTAFWTFSATLAGTLATVYFVNELGIRNNFLGGSLVLILVPMLGTVLTARHMGTLVDKRGIKTVLWWAHRLWALLPAFWIMATPDSALWWLGAAALTGGISVNAAYTASNKLVTRLPPQGHVSMYIAVSTCVASLAGGIGPLLGGLVLHSLDGMECTVGSYRFGAWHALFLCSLVLRNAVAFMVPKLVEPPAAEEPSDTDS